MTVGQILSENQDDWLYVDGSKLVDAWGNQVQMTGANWYGFANPATTPNLLALGNLNAQVEAMSEKGINTLRIPISTELIHIWDNDATKKQRFDDLVAACKEHGIKIIVDVHGAVQDPYTHTHPVWFKDDITVEDFYAGWELMAEWYKDDDTVIAFDLQNEPHEDYADSSMSACWGYPTGNDATCPDAYNWAYVATTAANRIHAIHPNVLIIVEGVETAPIPGSDGGRDWFWWGGNFMSLADADYRLQIDLQDKLIYSPHVYGPTNTIQDWHLNPELDFALDISMQKLLDRKWSNAFDFLREQEVSHLFMGEWGGVVKLEDYTGTGDSSLQASIDRSWANRVEYNGAPEDGKPTPQQAIDAHIDWLDAMVEYLTTYKISHTYWVYNNDSSDTGGLIQSDFVTWNDDYYSILERALWKQDGLFVGLDHRKALKGGTNAGEVYGVDPENDPARTPY